MPRPYRYILRPAGGVSAACGPRPGPALALGPQQRGLSIRLCFIQRLLAALLHRLWCATPLAPIYLHSTGLHWPSDRVHSISHFSTRTFPTLRCGPGPDLRGPGLQLVRRPRAACAAVPCSLHPRDDAGAGVSNAIEKTTRNHGHAFQCKQADAPMLRVPLPIPPELMQVLEGRPASHVGWHHARSRQAREGE